MADPSQTANYNLIYRGSSGIDSAGNPVCADLGGGLYRALAKHAYLGLSASEMGWAHGVCTALAAGSSLVLASPSRIPPDENGGGVLDWPELIDEHDQSTVTARIVDVSANLAIAPSVALPALEQWVAALGGTVTIGT